MKTSLALIGLFTLNACATVDAPPFSNPEGSSGAAAGGADRTDNPRLEKGGASTAAPTRGRLPSIVVVKTEGEGAAVDSEPPATVGDASPPWGGPPADPCESNAYTQNYCLHAAFVPSASYMPACANVPADAGCEIVHYDFAAPGDEGMWCCP